MHPGKEMVELTSFVRSRLPAQRFVLPVLLSILALSADVFCSSAAAFSSPKSAQSEPDNSLFGTGEWYLSWGYNRAAYFDSNMTISQPSMGNYVTLHNVSAHDSMDFGKLSFSPSSITRPQYNLRIGHVFNETKQLAWEINFDHYKFITDDDQIVRMSGTLGGQSVDRDIQLTRQVFRYRLNNGANLLLFNLVKRIPLIGVPGERGSLMGLGKAGIGLMIPHAENRIFDQPHDDGFQFGGGVGTGLETGARFMPVRHLFIELSYKIFLADYRGIHIDQGTASHKVTGHSVIFGVGLAFNRGSTR